MLRKRNPRLAAAVGILTLHVAAGAAAQTPFTCTGVQAYAMQDADTRIFEVGDGLGFTEVCPALGTEINNICYRSVDGLLYAVDLTPTGNQGIVQIDANCTVTPLPLTGLPTDRRFDAGDCLPDGGKMYVNIAGLKELYLVDLVNSMATAIPMTGATGHVHDWAYNPADGKLYGGDNSHGQLAILELLPDPDNPTSAVRTDVALAGLPSGNGPAGAYGGAWFNASLDRLFLHRNLGEVYEIDLGGPTVVAVHPNVPDSSRNDSAPCTAACDRSYFIQDDNAVVFRCDPSTPQLTCQQICDPLGKEINNAGFRKTDGLLYAVELTTDGNQGILRMDPESECAIEAATTTGLPTDLRFDAGDVTSDGTTLYINIAGLPTLYRVDLTTWPNLTATSLPIVGDTGNVHDWAHNPADGKLYGGDDSDGQLAVLEIGATDVQRVDTTVSQLPSGVAFGGAWINATGRLVLHRNNGEIWEVDLAGPSIHGPVWPERASVHNEGAACVE